MATLISFLLSFVFHAHADDHALTAVLGGAAAAVALPAYPRTVDCDKTGNPTPEAKKRLEELRRRRIDKATALSAGTLFEKLQSMLAKVSPADQDRSRQLNLVKALLRPENGAALSDEEGRVALVNALDGDYALREGAQALLEAAGPGSLAPLAAFLAKQPEPEGQGRAIALQRKLLTPLDFRVMTRASVQDTVRSATEGCVSAENAKTFIETAKKHARSLWLRLRPEMEANRKKLRGPQEEADRRETFLALLNPIRALVPGTKLSAEFFLGGRVMEKDETFLSGLVKWLWLEEIARCTVEKGGPGTALIATFGRHADESRLRFDYAPYEGFAAPKESSLFGRAAVVLCGSLGTDRYPDDNPNAEFRELSLESSDGPRGLSVKLYDFALRPPPLLYKERIDLTALGDDTTH